MQRTILTLISGAAIGAGTTLTLPDGETAQTVTPTAADIYTQEEVASLKLIQSDEGHGARYVIEKQASIDGVAPLTVNDFTVDGVEPAWDAVSAAARTVCEAEPSCTWTYMNSARSAGGILTAAVSGGPNVLIDQDVPELDALKASLLEDN